MTEISPERLIRLDVEYARFNSRKTVGDARPSEFSVDRQSPLTITRDPARRSSYYNRVLGITSATLPLLEGALEHLGEALSLRVDVDLTDNGDVSARLTELGLTTTQRLVWMVARTARRTPAVDVVRLGPSERERVREVLELEGPIETQLWERRREFMCTDRFRTFAVMADGALAALATTYIGEHGVILGNAFTRPEFRGRGYQQALLAARMADAEAQGAAWVVTDVEPESTSLRNCERLGFSVLCEQVLWESPKPA